MPWGARSRLSFAPSEQFHNILQNQYTTLYFKRTEDWHTASLETEQTELSTTQGLWQDPGHCLTELFEFHLPKRTTAILGRVCKFLHPRVTIAALWLYSTSSVKMQNGIFETTGTVLISSEGDKKAEHLNWMVVHRTLYFCIHLKKVFHKISEATEGCWNYCSVIFL